MALHYANKVKKVGFGEEKTEATVETVRRGDNVSCQEFVNQMALETGLPSGAIGNVFASMSEALAPFFKLGHGVYVGRSGKEEEGLGILYPKLVRTKVKVAQLDDEGKEKKDGEGNVIYDIKTRLSVGVGFRPSTALKAVLQQVSLRDVTEDTEDDTDDTTTSGDTTSGGNGQQQGTDFS